MANTTEQALKKAREYMQHKSLCDAITLGRQCNCGRDDAITSLTAASAEEAHPVEQASTAEDYLRGKYGAYRGHFAWRELEQAFNAGKASNSQPVSGSVTDVELLELAHKHGLPVYPSSAHPWMYGANLIAFARALLSAGAHASEKAVRDALQAAADLMWNWAGLDEVEQKRKCYEKMLALSSTLAQQTQPVEPQAQEPVTILYRSEDEPSGFGFLEKDAHQHIIDALGGFPVYAAPVSAVNVPEGQDVIARSAYDRLQSLCDSQAARIIDLEDARHTAAAPSAPVEKAERHVLTDEQAVILTGFTGAMCVNDFSLFHADVEKRLGRPVWTHQFPELKDAIKEAYRADFMALIAAPSSQKEGEQNHA